MMGFMVRSRFSLPKRERLRNKKHCFSFSPPILYKFLYRGNCTELGAIVMEKEIVLRAIELEKIYNKTVAVDGVSFEIAAGETVGLIGPNGAGKTTIIHMLLGLLTPTSGQIEIFGKDFDSCREYILERVNFIAAQVWLPGNLTLKQNLIIFSLLYGRKPSADKIKELLKTFRLEGFERRLASKLSSGESTRLNLAKAFINDPQLLFLDEPTAYLDPAIAAETREIIKKRQKELGTTILWTSHNMREIEEVSDRIIFLHKGKILAQGTAEELRRTFGKSGLEDIFISLAKIT